MFVAPISNNEKSLNTSHGKNIQFGHGDSFGKSNYTTGQKLVVAGTTALGVTGSLLALAKFQGHSIKPKNFLKFLKNTDFLFKEICSIGVGTCLGGLAGGYIIDKNPRNRKAKKREAVMQIGNITIPIATVDLTNKLCKKIGFNEETTKGKVVNTIACLGAVFAGIYLANFAMNKLSNVIFKDKSEERDIKATDLCPHVDDLLASAKYIAPKSSFVHNIGRIIPFALMVAGNEIGNKKAHRGAG